MVTPEPVIERQFTMSTRSVKQRESQEEIRNRGGYSRDIYRGGPIINREDKKIKLQNKMAFGIEDPLKEYRQRKKNTPLPTPVDRYNTFVTFKINKKLILFLRFSELENEIKERREFLEEMEALGQGPKYRAQISTQISGIIREMEQIDLLRNQELQQRLHQLSKDNKPLI